MSQLDRIEQALADHIKTSSAKHEEIIRAITRLETNEKVNYKQIEKNTATLQEHEGLINQGRGIKWLATILWVAITAGIAFLVSLWNHK